MFVEKRNLAQLYYLDKDIALMERRIEEKRAALEKMTAKYSDMPGKSTAEDYAKEELVDMINLLAVKKREAEIARSIGERFICSVDDPQIRLILSMRYIDKKSWRKIAFGIGGKNTEDSVRMMERRFWEKRKDTD